MKSRVLAYMRKDKKTKSGDQSKLTTGRQKLITMISERIDINPSVFTHCKCGCFMPLHRFKIMYAHKECHWPNKPERSLP